MTLMLWIMGIRTMEGSSRRRRIVQEINWAAREGLVTVTRETCALTNMIKEYRSHDIISPFVSVKGF
jgi:hypothetical protein